MTTHALMLRSVNATYSAVPELRMNEGLWLTFSALLDGPATARALSDRLQRPLVIVVRDLAKLSNYSALKARQERLTLKDTL
jgi:hypothetical protein